MPKTTKELLASEFLDEIRQRAEQQFLGRLHQAFVDWYVDAEFGRGKWQFTDGPGDGGIDAVVWRPEEEPPVVLIQSKFTERPAGTRLGKSAYREMASVVNAFRWGGELFDSLLENVRGDLRRLYRRAYQVVQRTDHWARGRKCFRLITTHSKRPGAAVEGLPRDCFLYSDDILHLYSQYRKGQTPRARPLELTIHNKLDYEDLRRGVSSYVFNAHLCEFQDYLDRTDVARLVARNIRYNLGGSIGRVIRRTYESSPRDFWYFHNGLTIICDDMHERAGIATLVNPSVVNGAQTLYAISGSARRSTNALVAVRVIVRGRESGTPVEDDQWLQNVIRGVNTQNKVKAYDFWSNEPEQFELQRRFRGVNVFYEKKRGEWKEYRNEARFRNFDTVSLPMLGDILTVCSAEDGSGVLLAKKGAEHVFDEKNYRRIFPPKNKVARHFERIYLAYRIYGLLDRCGYRTADEYRRQQHGFWNTLWLMHRGITSVPRLHTRASVRSIRAVFDGFSYMRCGADARKVVHSLTREVWSTWRKARSLDPERWTPNNFFKAKFGIKMLLRTAFPRLRKKLQALGRELEA